MTTWSSVKLGMHNWSSRTGIPIPSHLVFDCVRVLSRYIWNSVDDVEHLCSSALGVLNWLVHQFPIITDNMLFFYRASMPYNSPNSGHRVVCFYYVHVKWVYSFFAFFFSIVGLSVGYLSRTLEAKNSSKSVVGRDTDYNWNVLGLEMVWRCCCAVWFASYGPVPEKFIVYWSYHTHILLLRPKFGFDVKGKFVRLTVCSYIPKVLIHNPLFITGYFRRKEGSFLFRASKWPLGYVNLFHVTHEVPIIEGGAATSRKRGRPKRKMVVTSRRRSGPVRSAKLERNNSRQKEMKKNSWSHGPLEPLALYYILYPSFQIWSEMVYCDELSFPMLSKKDMACFKFFEPLLHALHFSKNVH